MEEKSSRYILSHSHGGDFNIEICCSCGEKPTAHTQTDAEKSCNPKTQPHTAAVVWCAVSRHTHIKSAEQNFDLLIGEGLSDNNKLKIKMHNYP
ncbi:MAG: hypothetical protein M1540_07280 [Candidatus Bathyarchaeota archaeon]|nr:hypothetical protein [Candidatus Bathyarchaeota archaeon]